MKKTALLLLATTMAGCHHLLAQPKQPHLGGPDIVSVTMSLSAFGVESDTYPSITATLNFKHHTSRCERSYYNPAYPNSTYQLSIEEMWKVQQLLQQATLAKLKPNYSTTRSDQPTSTMIICTTSRTFTIKDYGLEGAAPLPEIYHLVYKLEY